MANVNDRGPGIVCMFTLCLCEFLLLQCFLLSRKMWYCACGMDRPRRVLPCGLWNGIAYHQWSAPLTASWDTRSSRAERHTLPSGSHCTHRLSDARNWQRCKTCPCSENSDGMINLGIGLLNVKLITLVTNFAGKKCPTVIPLYYYIYLNKILKSSQSS